MHPLGSVTPEHDTKTRPGHFKNGSALSQRMTKETWPLHAARGRGFAIKDNMGMMGKLNVGSVV